jgi:hypothetical protein
VILYVLLGCKLKGALWFNFFAAAGELFYHSNIRTPRWVKFFIQRPELHSINHELDAPLSIFRTCRCGGRLFGNLPRCRSFRRPLRFPEE